MPCTLRIVRATSGASQNRSRLIAVIALTLSYMVIALVGSVLANSLALLTDAIHMLSHVGTLALTFLAVSLAMKPSTPERSFGYYRLEVLVGLLDGIILVAMDLYIFFQVYLRLLSPPDVRAAAIMGVATIGLILNSIGIGLLRGPSKRSLVFRAALLEVMLHALSSAGVIVAGTVIYLTGWYVADPIASALIGLIMIPNIYKLIMRSVNILMESAPSDISPTEVEKALLSIDGVTGVHHLHLWTITSGIHAASVHITTDRPEKWEIIQGEARRVLRENFSMAHATIQVEDERTHRLHSENTG
jgi:cobalt-zinc-cadmium efflux system protein